MSLVSSIYDIEIDAAANRYGVPFEWIKGVIGAESDFDPFAYRAEPRINDASYGLMQILYRTANGLGYYGPADGLFDVQLNIDLGTRLLRDLIASYGMDFDRVYSAYNSGSPTAYQTSSQVAGNVARAWRYVNAAFEAGYEVLADAAESFNFWLIAAAGAGVLLFMNQKKSRVTK